MHMAFIIRLCFFRLCCLPGSFTTFQTRAPVALATLRSRNKIPPNATLLLTGYIHEELHIKLKPKISITPPSILHEPMHEPARSSSKCTRGGACIKAPLPCRHGSLMVPESGNLPHLFLSYFLVVFSVDILPLLLECFVDWLIGNWGIYDQKVKLRVEKEVKNLIKLVD